MASRYKMPIILSVDLFVVMGDGYFPEDVSDEPNVAQAKPFNFG